MQYEQERRYSRQIILPEIGKSGQKKLLNSKVLVVGAGGLGSPALLYLAASGVGTIGIVDNDNVELSNLQRQVLHETYDIDNAKTESAKAALHDLNPEIEIKCYQLYLNAENIDEIVSGYDVVLDGSDNFETRFLVNDKCFAHKKTLISAAIQGFTGQLATFKAYLGEPHPCYRCIYPDVPPPGTIPSCSENGVLGPLAGVMGSWQATEVIKELLGVGKSLSGFLIVFDALGGNMRKVNVRRNSACKCCTK